MKKLFLFSAALLVSLTLSFSFVYAQPCAGVPPTGTSWGPQICETIPMVMPNSATCDVYVCYYTRVVSGVRQFCLQGASCPAGCYDISSLTNYNDFLAAVGIGVGKKFTPSPCPACPDVETVSVEIYNAGCHKFNTTTQMIESCSESFYCKRTYYVCCDIVGNMTYTLVATSQIGTVVNCPTVGGPGCYGSCDPY